MHLAVVHVLEARVNRCGPSGIGVPLGEGVVGMVGNDLQHCCVAACVTGFSPVVEIDLNRLNKMEEQNIKLKYMYST